MDRATEAFRPSAAMDRYRGADVDREKEKLLIRYRPRYRVHGKFAPHSLCFDHAGTVYTLRRSVSEGGIGMKRDIYMELTKKIRLQRRLHRCYELRTRYSATLIRVVNIVLPAEVIFLVLSKLTSLSRFVTWLTPLAMQIAIGAAASVLFIANLLTEVFESDRRPLLHRAAIDRLTELLDEITAHDWQSKSKRAREESYDHFNKRFLQIATSSPTFTDRQFHRAVVYSLRTKATNMARKEAPFAPFWTVRRIAKRKVAEVVSDRQDPLFEVSKRSCNDRGLQERFSGEETDSYSKEEGKKELPAGGQGASRVGDWTAPPTG